MAETAVDLGQNPDLRRINELLARPGLLKYEAAELRHLADLHRVKLQWMVYDLNSFVGWTPVKDLEPKVAQDVIL